MIDIKDVKSRYCISSCEIRETEELIKDWPTMTAKERLDWHTARVDGLKFDAREVLEDAIEDLTWDGYEEMSMHCMEQLKDEDVEELQRVLDRISGDPVYDVYWEDEKINPESELEDETSYQSEKYRERAAKYPQ